MTYDEIVHWLTYEAGIVKASNNHFGGDPAATPKMNANIQQRPGELASCINWLFIQKQLGHSLEYYAEIGACAGGTSLAMHNFLQFKELLIIDDGGAENPASYVADRKDQTRGQVLGFIPRVEIIGNSQDPRVIQHALTLSTEHLYDILFIDGDHSYEGVKKDTLNYLPIVRPGGIIMFHDTAHVPDIQRWLAELPPSLEKVISFTDSDPYTPEYPQGIGITLYQKIS